MSKQIKQISIFLENSFGRLDDVLQVFSDNDIDLMGLSIADTSKFGILRLIVNKPEKTLDVLKENGYTAKLSDVFAFAVADKPGGLATVMKELKANCVSVEYLYSLVRRIDHMAVLIIRVDDNENAEAVFTECGVRLLSGEEVYG